MMKKYFIRGNRIWCKAGSFEAMPIQFINLKGKLACFKCHEIVGGLNDEDIDNNSEVHSCAL